MTSARHTSYASEEFGRRATAQAVALVWPTLVVELHEAVEAALHGPATGEVLTPKRNAPVLVQDRALEPFDTSSPTLRTIA
jgi:hypothetical protein